MKTLIYSMSLNGEYSITLALLCFISDTHKDDVFEELIMPKNGVLTGDMLAKFKEADLVIFASGMYHFSLASQALDSINVIGDYLRQNCHNKAVTLFTTSGFMMDTIPHEQVSKWVERYGLKYIKGESIYSADMLNEKYKADVYEWYNNTIGTLASGHFTWLGWLVSACVGWITAHLITSFIPPNEAQDKVFKKHNIPSDSFKSRLLSSVVTGCIIMPGLAIFNIERSIAQTETEIVALYEQQSNLKSQQAELISQRSELKVQNDIDQIQGRINKMQGRY